MTDSTSYSRLQAENGADGCPENVQGSTAAPACSDETTPWSNTGCTFTEPLENKQPPLPFSCYPVSPNFRFDWYQATLPVEVSPLDVLRWADAMFGESKPGWPQNGYETCHDYDQATVSYGGHTGAYGVHVKIGGGDVCQVAVDAFRKRFPEHKPSRIDVCMDFRADDAWDALSEICQFAAKKFKLPTKVAGDWLDGKRGRTIYLNPTDKGKEAHTYMARLYEKGHEQRQRKVDELAPLDWVRLEFQIRPQKHARHLLATLTPDEVARSSRWMRHLCDALRLVKIQAVRISTRRIKPDVITALETMCEQYTGRIIEAKRDCWMDKKQFLRAMSDIWDREAFGGLPGEIRRNWYF